MTEQVLNSTIEADTIAKPEICVDHKDSSDILLNPEETIQPSASPHPTASVNHPDINTTNPSSSKVSSKSFTWPKSSRECLPSLSDGTIKRVLQDSSSFPINEECTALTIPPSGRHIIAGFTDGTVRLFDTTGRLWSGGRKDGMDDDDEDSDSNSSSSPFPDHASNPKKRKEERKVVFEEESLFDCDSSTDSKPMKLDPQVLDEGKQGPKPQLWQKKPKQSQMVLSKTHQTFGAVACQIYARGVITSLLMDVASSEDGLFAFGGVLRGSTELVALDLSGIERFHDEFEAQKKTLDSNHVYDLLDLIQVYRHSDAKLKGFGSCTRLKNGRRRLEYRLFTGKGIKNMHIWAFIPPQDDLKEPIWQVLYDTATNGNTINYLHFRYDSHGLLQGLTKSDDQKLRVWDLSFEQHKGGKRKDKYRPCVIKQLAVQSTETSTERPKRPPCVDVACTENALGVFGPYVFSGGKAMYNQISVTCLDVEDVSCPFNHSELALPFCDNTESLDYDVNGKKGSRSGRQQRGDLKSIASISGLRYEGRHVVLEMSDGSLMHYSQNDSQESSVHILPTNISCNKNDDPSPGIADDPTAAIGKTLCVSRIGREGCAILASAQYDPIQGRGSIRLRELTDGLRDKGSDDQIDSVEFWGFHASSSFNSESKVVDVHKNLPISTETPLQKPGRPVDKKKNKKLIQSETAQLFVTPEPKAVPSKARVPRGKATQESEMDKYSPEINYGIEVLSERNQSIEKELNLPPINTSQANASKPANVISDSPDMQQSLVVAEQRKRKAPDTKSSIASFFQKSKVRKGDKKDVLGISKSMKDLSSSPVVSFSTSDAIIAKDVPTTFKHHHDTGMSTEELTSYEFSAKYSDMAQKNQDLLQLKSAAEMFYSTYRNKRYRLSLNSEPPITSSHGVNVPKDPLLLTQEMARNQLSRKHFSEHERFLKSFLSCSQQVGECTNRNEARSWLDEFIHEREELLRDLLERQEIEAATLASLQSLKNGGAPVPKVLVSFPFPEIFSDVDNE